MAYYDRPLYERVLKDGSEVLTSWPKFVSLDPSDRLKLVREEIYTTALERILIPANYSGSPRRAYWWALRRTATSLFKNSWALFLMANLTDLYAPDVNYMQVHLDNRDKLILLEAPSGNM